MSFTDIEFPRTTVDSDVLSSQTSIEVTDATKEEFTELKISDDIQIPGELAFEASAPLANEFIPIILETVVSPKLYPKLEDLSVLTEEDIDQCGKEIVITLEPFKESDMEQLYSNAQIQQAEIFETEFVRQEMNENQKLVADHVLYILLRKYAQSRVQLKINQLNLNTLKKNCNNKLSKVWNMDKKTISGHGTCSDQKR